MRQVRSVRRAACCRLAHSVCIRKQAVSAQAKRVHQQRQQQPIFSKPCHTHLCAPRVTRHRQIIHPADKPAHRQVNIGLPQQLVCRAAPNHHLCSINRQHTGRRVSHQSHMMPCARADGRLYHTGVGQCASKGAGCGGSGRRQQQRRTLPEICGELEKGVPAVSRQSTVNTPYKVDRYRPRLGNPNVGVYGLGLTPVHHRPRFLYLPC
jgi:hypothetical protein